MHDCIGRLCWRAVGLNVLQPLVISLCALQSGSANGQEAAAEPSASPPSVNIYDSDPNHLWNRLFVTFYRQKFATIPSEPNGQITEAGWVGPDVLDPPIGYHPKFLLADEPFEKCNALLNEFLSRNGAALIHDPLKRALLQRDLWGVFDVLAQAGDPMLSMGDPSGSPPILTAAQERHRSTLERKLAQVIHSLALSQKEIEKLPDTYSAAVQSGAFSDVVTTNGYDYLPHDLFAADSRWREILPGGLKEHPIILRHTLIAGGRSIFRTFIKLLVGAKDTTILDEAATSFRRNTGKPYFGIPLGGQFLLLREMISLDEKGQMVATHVVESVQFRSLTHEHGFAREAEMNRALLFQGRQGGLRPIPKGELRALGYSTLGHLHDDPNGNGPSRRRFPGNCADCHMFVNNSNAMLSHAESFVTPVRSASIEPIARWKEETGKLDLLREFIAAPASDGR